MSVQVARAARCTGRGAGPASSPRGPGPRRAGSAALLALSAWTAGCTCAESRIRYILVEPDAAVGADGSDAALDGRADSGADGGEPCLWEAWNTGLVGGQVNEITFDPNVAGRVFASAGSRFYLRTAPGFPWRQQSQGAGVRRMAVPPGPRDRILGASTRGVLETLDAGATWPALALGGLAVRTVAVAASAPQRVYGAVALAGVVKSTDGGHTWQTVVQGIPPSRIEELAVHPADPDTVLAVAYDGDPDCGANTCALLVRTTDAGASWSVVEGPHPRASAAVAFCATDPSVVYAAVGDRVLVSTDAGETFESAGLPLNLDVQGVAAAGAACARVYAASYASGVHRSDDGGATWTGPLAATIEDFTTLLSLDGVTVDPADPDHLYVVSQSAAFESTDGAFTFALQEGLGFPSLRSVHVRAGAPGTPDELWLATWGTGIWRRAMGAGKWTHVETSVFPVDFAQVARPSPLSPVLLVAGDRRSGDDGVSFTKVVTPQAMDVDFDPDRPGHVAVVTMTKGLLLSDDDGATFEVASGDLAPWPTAAGESIDMRAVRFVPGAPGTLVVGTNGRGLLRTTDDGETWAAVGPHANAFVDCLLWNPATSSLFACAADAGVLRSTDGGATWVAVTADLPAMQAFGLAYDAQTEALFVASGGEVHQSSDNGDSWAPLGNAECVPGGLARPAVASDGAARWLVAASSGDGIYRHPLP